MGEGATDLELGRAIAVGESKDLRLGPITDPTSPGNPPVNPAGWTLELAFRAGPDEPLLLDLVDQSRFSVIVAAGPLYYVDVTLSATDTRTIGAGERLFALKRTDPGDEGLLTDGTVEFYKAAAQ